MKEADFNEFILANMPYFIAVNYQHLLEAQKPQERVNLIVHIYDLLLRTVTITLVSQYLRYLSQDQSHVNNPDLKDLNDLLWNQFANDELTLDIWQDIFFAAFKFYRGSKAKLMFMPELYNFYWDTSAVPHTPGVEVVKTIKRLTQVAVGIQSEKELPQNEVEWSALAQEIWERLKNVLSDLSFMGKYELIRILDFDQTSYRFELHKGVTITVGHQHLPNHPAFKRGYFYLRKGTEAFLGLHPLLVFWQREREREIIMSPDTGIYDRLFDEQLQFLLSMSDKNVVDDNERIVKEFELLLYVLKKVMPPGQDPRDTKEKLTWSQLVEMCTEITHGRMATVSGKFHEELYLQRHTTHQEFAHFLQSEKRCFVLIGPSGVGKSNFLLATGEELRRSRKDICILMYDGANVNMVQSLTEIISKDIADHLGRPVQNIWSEIAKVDGMQKRIVLLCVDAINENPQATKLLEQLDDLVQKRAWPWLKVVFSCRPETWRSIKRGVKLAEDFYYQEQGTESREVELEAFSYSERMEDFTRQELAQAYVKYQQVFNLQTPYEGLAHDVRETLREPLNLWLVASTYRKQTIPPTLKVTELVEGYIAALVETKRLAEEDLHLLEEQLAPLLLREGHYHNEITAADIATGGKKLHLLIRSEQVRRDGHKTNQSFINLLETDILVRQQQGREQKIAFKYERFYEYFVGKRIAQLSASQANRSSFFVELIEATSTTPFLWGAVRNALAQEGRGRGSELLVKLCYTDQQRVKEMLVNVLIYLGQDDLRLVETLLKSLVPAEKKVGEVQKIRQVMRKPAEEADLRTRNARKIAIEVASHLKLSWVLQTAALQPDPTTRAVAVRYSYYLWQRDQAAGFAVLEYLAEQATAGLIPNFVAFESVVGLSLIIFCDHYQEEAVLSRLQGVWRGMIAKLFHVREGRNPMRDFIRERIIAFAITIVFSLFGQLPSYNMLSYQALEAFFQLGAAEKELYRRLVHYFDVNGDYSREQMEQDYLAVLKIDNVLVSLTTLIGLVAHACSAPQAFLPFLKQLFEAAKSDVATYPYLTIINNVTMDVLERDPMNDEMFDFFVYTTGVCRECYTRHNERYHNRNAEAPQVLATAPYIVFQYRRTGTVRTTLLEAPIQAALSQHHLTFFDIMLTSELPQVGIEKQEPRAALAALEVFFKSGDDEINHNIQGFLSRLRIYYPDEVEDFLEEQQAPQEFRFQVRTHEPVEKVGDLIAKRPWVFARDGVLLGSSELRSQLQLLFEKAAECKDTKAWMEYNMRLLVNLIYGDQVLRQSK